MNVFTLMIEEHKSPDYPWCEESNHFPKTLNISEKLMAVWDYDYNQLSIVLKNEETILTNHVIINK